MEALIIIGLIAALVLIACKHKLSSHKNARPTGRFNYSEGRYRRRLLRQSRRDYPGQSESWHLRRVDRLLDHKKQTW